MAYFVHFQLMINDPLAPCIQQDRRNPSAIEKFNSAV